MRALFKKHFALTDKGAQGLVVSSIASLCVYIVNMLPAMFLVAVLDRLIMGRVHDQMTYIMVSMLILILLYFALSIEYDVLYNNTYKESANLRLDIATILSELPLSYFSTHNLTDLSQTIMADVAAIEHAMSHSMAKTIGFILFLPIISILLMIGNWKMGLAVVVPLFISFMLIIWSKSMQLKQNKKYYAKLRDNSDSFQEAIEMHMEIKSFGLEEAVTRNLNVKMEEAERIHLKTEFTAATPIVISGVIVQLILAIVLMIGMKLFMTGEISLIYFVGYILISLKIKELGEGISQNITELYYIDAMIERIHDIRNTPKQKGSNTEITGYDIDFENVSFGYNQEVPVLRNVNFTAKQNEVTALVGMSGCGKTSILRLISRLYDYNSGSIKLDGQDIQDISVESLFNKISIVFQDVTLFNASVLENIRIGNQAATDQEVIHAARLANCEAFIDELPNGYETVIGENGAMLSGGERQRISIARAFLKNAPIIILDEIAASLDVENEKKIQDSLNELTRNRTVIIISHRLKSIEKVDKIVVLNDGRVEAYGTHAQLIEQSKTYRNLIQKTRLAESFNY